MKVLVIGGSGVVGSAIAQRLHGEGLDVVCMSRGSEAPIGRSLRGDVRSPDFGLSRGDLAALRDGLTHIVSCFGSVDWQAGPSEVIETHRDGTREVIRFARDCPGLTRLVHVSSVLVFGRSQRTVGNRDLDVGQGFRSWYELGKLMAERALREDDHTPWRVLRLGPVLGVEGPVAPSVGNGLPATLPFLLRGYPVHLDEGGAFPCYVGESTAAAAVIAQACHRSGSGDTWTWYDQRRQTLAQVLTSLCAPWRVVPRLVSSKLVARMAWALAPSLGLSRASLAYATRWVQIDPKVLEELPANLPQCPADYCEATGEMLKHRMSEASVR